MFTLIILALMGGAALIGFVIGVGYGVDVVEAVQKELLAHPNRKRLG